MNSKNATTSTRLQPIVSLLDDALVEEHADGDWSIFEHGGIGHICRVSHGLTVGAKQIATLFAVAGELLHVAANVVRHHDAGTLSHSGDSANIERLRELCDKVAG